MGSKEEDAPTAAVRATSPRAVTGFDDGLRCLQQYFYLGFG